MPFLGTFETFADQIHFDLRGLDARLGFFLESVKHIDPAGQANGVNSAIGVAPMVPDNLEHACAAETTERFSVGVFATLLGDVECVADEVFDRLGKGAELLSGGADPDNRLKTGRLRHPSIMSKLA